MKSLTASSAMIAMTCCLSLSTGSIEQLPQSIVKDVGTFHVSVTETGTENRPTFSVHVQRANTGADFTLGRIASLDTLGVFAYETTRLILVGDHQIFLFDPSTGVEVDSFMAFDASVSPDGRFIAMERMIPLHGGGLSDAVYLVYDVNKSAILNRVSSADGDDAGVPVYPAENRLAIRYHLDQVSSATAHTQLSPLVWVGPLQFAFVDNCGASTKAVLVDISQSVTVPDIQELELDPAKLLNLARLANITGSPAALMRMDRIDVLPATSPEVALRLILQPAPWVRTPTVDIQFGR